MVITFDIPVWFLWVCAAFFSVTAILNGIQIGLKIWERRALVFLARQKKANPQ